MTLPQAKTITADIALEYLGDKWMDRLSTGQAQIWHDALKSMKNYKAALEAKRQLFINRPSYKKEFNYRMPDVDLFKTYYDHELAADSSYCPCCRGTGWIYYDTDSVKPCNHKRPTVDDPCNIFLCRPREDSPCPFGKKYYDGKKIDFMKKIKQDRGYQEGLAMLKDKGKLVEQLADNIQDVPDAEDNQEEIIPF